MPEVNVVETLEMVGKAKTREEKKQILLDLGYMMKLMNIIVMLLN